MRFVDVAANLLDDMYEGHYNGKSSHPPDLDAVLERAWNAGLKKIIITAGSLADSKHALALSHRDERLFCTVGCHPTRATEPEQHPGGPTAYFDEMRVIAQEGVQAGKVVAIGECGLDYDRLHFSSQTQQQACFREHFKLAQSFGLPMFLHSRAAADDFHATMVEHDACYGAGLVHSFTGTQAEAASLLAIPRLMIGVNGCSLKTDANVDVVAGLPSDRIMLETDCPWCEIRPTHAGFKFLQPSTAGSGSGGSSAGAGQHQQSQKGQKGKAAAEPVPPTETSEGQPARDKKKHDPAFMVKGRNEPASLRRVFQVVAGCRGLTTPEQELEFSEQLWHNTHRMFFAGGST
ncbi:MAG: hypothetical protein WDW36_000886 [Sanguina aurantia]